MAPTKYKAVQSLICNIKVNVGLYVEYMWKMGNTQFTDPNHWDCLAAKSDSQRLPFTSKNSKKVQIKIIIKIFFFSKFLLVSDSLYIILMISGWRDPMGIFT